MGFIALVLVAWAVLSLAGALPDVQEKRQAAWDWPQAYGPPAYGPPGYGSPSSYSTGLSSTRIPLSTSPISSSPSAGSTEVSPIGFTNSSSVHGSTGFNPSFTSKPRTATYAESSETTVTLTSQITLTTTVSLSTGASAGQPSLITPSHNYTWTAAPSTSTGSREGSPVEASSSSSHSSRPWYSNSTSIRPGPTGTGALTLTTGYTLTSTSTIRATITLYPNTTSTRSYITFSNSNAPTRPLGTAPLSTGGSTEWSPISASSSSVLPPYTNSSRSISDLPTPWPIAIAPRPSNTTLGSPIGGSNTTSPVYPTAYPHPSRSRTLTWGVPPLSTGATLVSPITATRNSTSSTTISSSTWSPYYPISSPLLSTGGSTLGSPVTATGQSTSSIPTPTFSSGSRFPGSFPPTTSTVSDLETFPTIVPDSTTFSITTTAPSSGFVTSASVTVSLGTGRWPPPYATKSYAGPPSYGAYGQGQEQGGRGSGWFGSWGRE